MPSLARAGIVALLLLVVAGLAQAEGETGGVVPHKIVGMYVHQHWSYKHPYAARTWTVEDWRGYLDGLKRIGFNTVLIWPVMETMPNPLTPSDVASLEKIANVIDIAHREFGMKAFLTLSPNANAKDEEASKYSFEDRPFFYCDKRVDVRDPAALGALLQWREKLLQPVRNADGVLIIDSDPGGWPGATNIDFVYLLNAHRKMFDRVRPGIALYYWIHAGWESYCKYYETGHFEVGGQAEIEDAILLLSRENPEPWGLASGHGPGVADKLGMNDRVLTFSYGAIEGEPSFPMTNFGGEQAYAAGKNSGARGTMGNSQTHCVQLPNTFAFARGAQNLPCEEADYVTFADDLLPGHGREIVDGWRALASGNVGLMTGAADKLQSLATAPVQTGPLRGLLFGDPQRFLTDLVKELRLFAALEELYTSVVVIPADNATVKSSLLAFADAATAWQNTHEYKNMWHWERMERALEKLNIPVINAALERREYKSKDTTKTPFEQVQEGYYLVETYTPNLIEAMRRAAEGL
jgi:hypothetical protein